MSGFRKRSAEPVPQMRSLTPRVLLDDNNNKATVNLRALWGAIPTERKDAEVLRSFLFCKIPTPTTRQAKAMLPLSLCDWIWNQAHWPGTSNQSRDSTQMVKGRRRLRPAENLRENGCGAATFLVDKKRNARTEDKNSQNSKKRARAEKRCRPKGIRIHEAQTKVRHWIQDKTQLKMQGSGRTSARWMREARKICDADGMHQFRIARMAREAIRQYNGVGKLRRCLGGRSHSSMRIIRPYKAGPASTMFPLYQSSTAWEDREQAKGREDIGPATLQTSGIGTHPPFRRVPFPEIRNW